MSKRSIFFVCSLFSFSLDTMEEPPNLFLLASTGDVAKLKAAITKDTNINQLKNKRGEALLHVAGSPEVVKFLLDLGADINAPGHYHQTPLHRALWGMNKEVATCLITAGADVNCRDALTLTKAHGTHSPLDIALTFCATDLIALLLAHGADVNATINGQPVIGWRPLHWAARNTTNRFFPYENKITELLIDYAGDITLKNDNGSTPVHMAVTRDKSFLKTVLTRVPRLHVIAKLHEQHRKVAVSLFCCFKYFKEVGLPVIPKDIKRLLLGYVIARPPYCFYNEKKVIEELAVDKLTVVKKALQVEDNIKKRAWDYAVDEWKDLVDPDKVQQHKPAIMAFIMEAKKELTLVAANNYHLIAQ